MARERDLRLAVDIAFWAPRWAVARPGSRPDRERDAVSAGAFADFAEAVARRYPSAVAFTVWNEPNHNVFLLPQWERAGGRAGGPRRHTATGRWCTRPCRASSAPRPERSCSSAATSSVGADRGDDPGDRMAPLTFLREMACVDERMQPLQRPECRGFEPLPGDGWSHHPYSLELEPGTADPRPDNVRMGDLGRLTTMLAALHEGGRTQRRLGLYLTESGYQTDPPDPTWDVSTADQARWLPEGERIARADPAVRSVAQFLVRDLPERPGADLRTRWRDYQSGLRFEDGRPKPAHAAFALALTARPDGPGRVRFWGLVRPGEGEREARVEVRGAGGAWRTLVEATTGTDGTFTGSAAADPADSFRLRSGERAGAILEGVGRIRGRAPRSRRAR